MAMTAGAISSGGFLFFSFEQAGDGHLAVFGLENASFGVELPDSGLEPRHLLGLEPVHLVEYDDIGCLDLLDQEVHHVATLARTLTVRDIGPVQDELTRLEIAYK